jgi:hypothetical protein
VGKEFRDEWVDIERRISVPKREWVKERELIAKLLERAKVDQQAFGLRRQNAKAKDYGSKKGKVCPKIFSVLAVAP